MATLPRETGSDTSQDILKTLGLSTIGLVGLLGFVALIFFHPAWIVTVALILTLLAMAVIIGTTRM